MTSCGAKDALTDFVETIGLENCQDCHKTEDQVTVTRQTTVRGLQTTGVVTPDSQLAYKMLE